MSATASRGAGASQVDDGEEGCAGPETVTPRPADGEGTSHELRARLVAHLRARQGEIEDAVETRVRTVGGPAVGEDAEFVVGVRAALSAGLDYCFRALEQGANWSSPVPPEFVAQARRAARYGLSLETSVRRVIAAHRLLVAFVAAAATDVGLSTEPSAMAELRGIQEALVLEHLVPALATHHVEEREALMRSAERRRLEVVQKLLAGDHVEPSELHYQLADSWHLGVIARGVGLRSTLSGVANRLGLELLSLSRGEDVVWAWLGARRGLPLAEIERLLEADKSTIALGEPGHGVEGWRLTHEQAQATLSVALHRGNGVTRCSDVTLEAALLRHEGLRKSIVESYLTPLRELRMGEAVAHETLRAYMDCERNTTSTAFRLGVARHTVEKRLRDIDAALSRPVKSCLAELEVALRLEAIAAHRSTRTHSGSASP